jgi:hypothetical protein
MNTLNMITALEYTKYKQWDMLRKARNARLVNQSLRHGKGYQESTLPTSLFRQDQTPLPLWGITRG